MKNLFNKKQALNDRIDGLIETLLDRNRTIENMKCESTRAGELAAHQYKLLREAYKVEHNKEVENLKLEITQLSTELTFTKNMTNSRISETERDTRVEVEKEYDDRVKELEKEIVRIRLEAVKAQELRSEGHNKELRQMQDRHHAHMRDVMGQVIDRIPKAEIRITSPTTKFVNNQG